MTEFNLKNLNEIAKESIKVMHGDDARVNYFAFIPLEIKEKKYVGNLYGYYVPNTATFNIIGTNPSDFNKNIVKIGSIGFSDNEGIIGTWYDDTLKFTYHGNNVECKYYSLSQELYSRNTGILESKTMLNKRAVLVGCGSVGSFLALELAKSGVGKFVLIDNDIFEYHNICRHQCGIFDVGKRKVDAIKERILSINPNADVTTFPCVIQNIYDGDLEKYLDKNTIILSSGDNRYSAHVVNVISEKYNVPFIACGGGIRATTGEIFYYIPGIGMPCYSCAFGENIGVDTSNRVRRVTYANEEKEFQPGIAADIDQISIVTVKLALDLLMRNEQNYSPRLLKYFTQMTLICNYPPSNEDEKDINNPNYNPIQQIFTKPLELKSCETKHRDGCYLCDLMKKNRNIKSGI